MGRPDSFMKSTGLILDVGFVGKAILTVFMTIVHFSSTYQLFGGEKHSGKLL